MNKKELLNFIDNMELSKNEYKIMNNLVNNAPPKLFTKIIEEMALGNFFIKDLELIGSSSTNKMIEDSIEKQAKLYNTMINLTKLRKAVDLRFGTDTVKDITLGTTSSDNKYNELLKEEKLDIIENILTNDPIENEYLISLSYLFANNEENINKFLLSRDDYIIPIQFNDISLTKFDYDFMISNSLTEDEVKKIKALMYYIFYKKGGNINE